MQAIELIDRSPLQAVVASIRGGLEAGQIGGVLARAGVGKSTFLVHVALNSLVRGIDVLHVSLTDSPAHVRSYYDEIFSEITRSATPLSDPTAARIAIERHRVIHSCLGREFHAEDLGRVLDMMAEVMDFKPTVVVLDGLDSRAIYSREGGLTTEWAALAASRSLRLWVSLRSHREGPTAEDLAGGFSTAIALDPEGRDVLLRVLRVGGEPATEGEVLHLDPVTMLVRPEDVQDPVTTPPSPAAEHCTFYSGGAMGAEAYFGEVAERYGLSEVNFTFDGHNQQRSRGRKLLSDRELAAGAVSLVYVSHRLHRHWEKTPLLRKVLQVLWHVVSHADQVFVVGVIQEDGTVHGGTGWSVELARRWNKPVWVFDQEKERWYVWDGTEWREGTPVIESPSFAGSGTRFLTDAGRAAIDDLFARSFGQPAEARPAEGQA